MSTEWQSIVSAIEAANNELLNFDLSKIREEIKSVRDLTKDIKIGDVISDEDYKTLMKYKGEWADMFLYSADGYQFNGTEDMEDFFAEIAKSQLAEGKATI
jgi:hypothetical protein